MSDEGGVNKEGQANFYFPKKQNKTKITANFYISDFVFKSKMEKTDNEHLHSISIFSSVIRGITQS